MKPKIGEGSPQFLNTNYSELLFLEVGCVIQRIPLQDKIVIFSLKGNQKLVLRNPSLDYNSPLPTFRFRCREVGDVCLTLLHTRVRPQKRNALLNQTVKEKKTQKKRKSGGKLQPFKIRGGKNSTTSGPRQPVDQELDVDFY